MRLSDFVRSRRIITIRYRDKYVDLVSDTDRYGTMTQYDNGNRVEFDFSECRVVGVRDVWPLPIVADPNAPKEGVMVTREQLQAAARQIGDGQ